MNACITVLPQKGYINTTFGFKLTGLAEKFSLTISKEGEVVSQNHGLEPSDSIFQQFNTPGSYQALLSCADGTQVETHFEVGDASQLGGSILNYVHANDDNPIVLLVKKDRTVVYDAESHQRFEMLGVSPTRVLRLNKNFLLFETLADRDNKICNYGFFDTRTLEFEFEILQAKLILHENNGAILVLEEQLEKRLAFIEVRNDDFVDYNRTIFFPGQAIGLGQHHKLILNQDSEHIRIINRYGNEVVRQFSNAEEILIDLDGGLIARFKDGHFAISPVYSKAFTDFELDDYYDLVLHLDYVHSNFKSNRGSQVSAVQMESQLKKLASMKVWEESIEMGAYFEVIDEEAETSERTSYAFYLLADQIMVRKNWTSQRYAMARCRKSKYHRTEDQILWEFNPISEKSAECSFHFLKGNGGIASGLERQSELEITYTHDKSAAKVYCPSSKDFFIFGPGDFIYPMPERYAQAGFFKLKDGGYYLLNEEEGQLEVIRIEPCGAKRQALFSGKITQRAYLEHHGLLWFKAIVPPKNTGTLQELYIYDITKNAFQHTEKEIPGGSAIEMENGTHSYQTYRLDRQGFAHADYFLCQNAVYVSLEPFEIKAGIAGKPIGYSPALNKMVCFRDDDGYYLYSYDNEQDIYIQEKIEGLQASYQQSELLPNGQSVLLRTNNSNKIDVYDIAKDEIVSFFTGRFLSFSNEGNIILEEDMSRKIKVFDPNTFEDITPAQFQFYRYLSPDGKLYSQLSSSTGYYHLLDNREISQHEFEEIISAFDRLKDEPAKEYEQRRASLFKSYKNRYARTINSDGYIINEPSQIATKVTFIQIGITGTDVVAKIPSRQLSYFNCLSFSYDNRYVGLVGKPYGDGMFQIFKIDFDEKANTLSVLDRMIYDEPNKATWICSFSSNGYFGTYDSNPASFFMKIEDSLFDIKYQPKASAKLQIVKKKSFECFSNNGELAALSEKGYSPMSLGGSGHLASRELHIYDLEKGNVIKSYPEHGADVKFAAFSADDKRLLSRSEDGVIIVRNVSL